MCNVRCTRTIQAGVSHINLVQACKCEIKCELAAYAKSRTAGDRCIKNCKCFSAESHSACSRPRGHVPDLTDKDLMENLQRRLTPLRTSGNMPMAVSSYHGLGNHRVNASASVLKHRGLCGEYKCLGQSHGQSAERKAGGAPTACFKHALYAGKANIEIEVLQGRHEERQCSQQETCEEECLPDVRPAASILRGTRF